MPIRCGLSKHASSVAILGWQAAFLRPVKRLTTAAMHWVAEESSDRLLGPRTDRTWISVRTKCGVAVNKTVMLRQKRNKEQKR
jgi:hypothetical protein